MMQSERRSAVLGLQLPLEKLKRVHGTTLLIVFALDKRWRACSLTFSGYTPTNADIRVDAIRIPNLEQTFGSLPCYAKIPTVRNDSANRKSQYYLPK